VARRPYGSRATAKPTAAAATATAAKDDDPHANCNAVEENGRGNAFGRASEYQNLLNYIFEYISTEILAIPPRVLYVYMCLYVCIYVCVYVGKCMYHINIHVRILRSV
jgi:hypothetical protein